MIGRIAVVAVAICIGACAASGPEAPAQASADAVASEEPSAALAGEIHDLDAHDVPQSASVEPVDKSSEVVCRKEQIAGTRMVEKICRTRAEIEKESEEGQEALRQMRYPATGGSCALSQQGC